MTAPEVARKLALVATATLLAAPQSAWAEKVVIKAGTLAPEGSVWHQTLMRVSERWRGLSQGSVELKIYPGGVLGDEGDMVRKIRIGQLHAAMVTGFGLGTIHRSTVGLQIPMVIRSWEELDYVRDRIGPKMERDLEANGFVVLDWGDGGWIHFFSKKPATTPDDFRKLKLFVNSGDPAAEKIWRKLKFNPVPLSSADVLTGLQTGMIDAFQITPLYALGSQWFGAAKNMAKIPWAPLSGGTVVSKKQWEKIDPKLRDGLKAAFREASATLRRDVRAMSENAITEMKKHGLSVIEPTPEVIDAWRKAAESAYPDVRGAVVPEATFDEILALVEEFRKSGR